MPKRKAQKRIIDRYREKIRILEESEQRKRRRIIYSDDSSDENNSDNEQTVQTDQVIEEISQENKPDTEESATGNDPQEEPSEPELDLEILAALGDAIDDAPKFGPKVHDKLARLWQPILKKGLDKEAKDKLLKQYLIPENCALLQAPKLNPEIAAAVSDATRARDKRVESVQQQLGIGISALTQGLHLLLDDDGNRLQSIKLLSESCRVLCDLHFVETAARKKFVTTGLDKSFLNLIQEVDRDEMLFGNKLSEKIKASKLIEKQGLLIKKVTQNVKPTNSTAQASTSRSRQGNWPGPPRYPSSNRGGRGAYRKTAPVGRAAPQATQQKTSGQSKPRAQFQQR
ncbi:uncharacterized protein LOC126381642 [Pectinophora gossypiella]|uniref:uncharacterized protein LOC126381642 n=1 Tax=Pectinophora gossypiella TaxID=13191 RepID=UPI00214F04C7|nr:uncharacterized protein LOC126381642 [Pectinophora gossypiella]